MEPWPSRDPEISPNRTVEARKLEIAPHAPKVKYRESQDFPGLLGGSGDLVSKVISPPIISNYKYSYLIYNPSY